ncbi:hypothetical protein ACWXVL_01110 [Mycoplasma sp. 128]|uniref:hypothetical protein n=1 Tax=Mycoplasma sp. 3341 TaxID=3447506 RepID=UPI003F656D8C
MAQKMRDNRQNDDIVKTSVSNYLNEFVNFAKQPRLKKYNEQALIEIFEGITWMSQIDRKLAKKQQEFRKQHALKNNKNAVEYEYAKWSQDSRAQKIEETSTKWPRVVAIGGFAIALIVVVLLILTVTVWAPTK